MIHPRKLWKGKLDEARYSILSYLKERDSSVKLCGGRVYNDLFMKSIDAALTLAMDALDELRDLGMVEFYEREDGLKMVRIIHHEPKEEKADD